MSEPSPLVRRARSFRYAFKGVAQLFATQANAKIHAAVAVAVLVLAGFLGLPARDWALLALAIGAVLTAEALNTALEALADRVAPDHHPLVARCKDVAAAAVLLAAGSAAIVGLLLLGPPLLARIVG